MLTPEFKDNHDPTSLCWTCQRKDERCNPTWFNLEWKKAISFSTAGIAFMNQCSQYEQDVKMSQHETIALRHLATQRGARMQILREAMIRGQDWEAFLADKPEAAAWFDEDGVQVRGTTPELEFEEAIARVKASSARLGETIKEWEALTVREKADRIRNKYRRG